MEFTVFTPTTAHLLDLAKLKHDYLQWNFKKEKSQEASLRKTSLNSILIKNLEMTVKEEILTYETNRQSRKRPAQDTPANTTKIARLDNVSQEPPMGQLVDPRNMTGQNLVAEPQRQNPLASEDWWNKLEVSSTSTTSPSDDDLFIPDFGFLFENN